MERLDLVKMSMKHKDIIDAKLTNMFFFRDKKDEMGELVKHISFFDFFKVCTAYTFPFVSTLVTVRTREY